MKAVWPDSFVEEANLSQTIFVLRKTLGTDAGGRPYIDTIPRRGYRFAADVRAFDHAADKESAPHIVGRYLPWAVALVLIIAVVSGVSWRLQRSHAMGGNALAGKARVAVLPFENLAPNRADDWLGSAFSDSVTAGLEGVEGLICVSRDRIVELYHQRGIRDASAVDAG